MTRKTEKQGNGIRRVAIVEDDGGLREQLEDILSGAERACCVGSYCSAEEALEGIVAANPDVILMDIKLPRMSGIECVARLRQVLPDARVIMLTVYEDSDLIFQALQAGADGYLVKSSSAATLLDAVSDVYKGGSPISSHIARKVVRQFRQMAQPPDEAENLSRREKEVLELLACGYVYKEIADQMGIGVETIKTYVKNICKKLHVRNRVEAVARYAHK
jgi:DNA-binding NarL/FixJ family response regulator